MYKSKTIIFLLLAAAINIHIADAQENRGQQQGGGNRPQQQRQESRQGTRQPATSAPVQRGDRGMHGNNQTRPAPNAGTSRPAPPFNNADRTTRPADRPNPVSPPVTRPSRQSTNRPVNVTVNVNRPGTSYSNRGHYVRPVYNAKNPGWRYANLPRRNSVINVLPPTYKTIHYGTYDYRYNNGVFYRPYNNTFMVVAPPAGIYINILPVGYRRIYVHNHPYYYYNGTYYDNRDNNYLVVSPPVGAVVQSLPAGYETVTIDGETYYTVDGAQYKPVVQDNGEIWYEVIKAN